MTILKYKVFLEGKNFPTKEDIEDMREMLRDIEDYHDINIHYSTLNNNFGFMINKNNWNYSTRDNPFSVKYDNSFILTEDIKKILIDFKEIFTQMGYDIKFKFFIEDQSNISWYDLDLEKDEIKKNILRIYIQINNI
jgi:hypothetical protein